MPSASIRDTSRRALFVFIGVLTALVMAIALIIVLPQREQQSEMGVLGELVTEALLPSDCASVEALVRHWVDRHEHLAAVAR